MYSVLLYNYTIRQSSDQTNKPSVWKFLRIKMSEKRLTQRFHVTMTSLSSDKDKLKTDSVYEWIDESTFQSRERASDSKRG